MVEEVEVGEGTLPLVYQLVYFLQVLSQLSADGTLSASTIDEVERVLLGRCSNDSRRDPLSRREIVCVDAVGEIVGQLRTNRSPAQPRNSRCYNITSLL